MDKNKPCFSDIHIHMLSGVDDGAKTETESQDMLDMAYRDGTRVFCLTPHFHPGFFGDNRAASEKAFDSLSSYAREKYPDAKLLLGNELRYSPNCVEWLNQGHCRTMNNTRFALVDFSESVERTVVTDAVYRLLNAGYTPILAHVERYGSLHKDFREIRQYKECGAVIQIDGPSIFGEWGFQARQRSRRLLEARLVDLVCSDAHGTTRRVPQLSASYEYVLQHCGESYAEAVCSSNALKILETE